MRLLGVASAVLLTMALAGPAVGAADEGEVSFLVRPAPEASTDPGGGYFVLDAEPGSQLQQILELRNDSEQLVVLQLAAVDALTGPRGGASFGLATDDAKHAGTWISLDEAEVSLGPGESARVAFTVTVPGDARNGEHLAGLSVAAVEAEAPVATADPGGGASVVIHTRRVVAVQVNLPGATEPELVIDGVRPVASPEGLQLEIDIDHVGSELTTGEGTIVVAGDEEFERDITIDTFVPGTSIAYPVQWTTDPRQGTSGARVEIRYDGQVATWEGDIVVDDEVLAEAEDRRVDPSAGDPAWLRFVPWALGALVLVVAAAVAGYLMRRRWTPPTAAAAVPHERDIPEGRGRHRS